jgi:hypothetical protein
MEMARPMISSQNAVIALNYHSLMRAWITDHRSVRTRIEADASGATILVRAIISHDHLH